MVQLADLVFKQAATFITTDVIYPLYQAWKEIEDAQLDDIIKDIIQKYHDECLKFSLRVLDNWICWFNYKK